MLDGNQVIYKDYSNPVTHTLTYDKVAGLIYYNYGSGDILLHSTDVIIPWKDVSGTIMTTVTLESIDSATCDLATTSCNEGVIII